MSQALSDLINSRAKSWFIIHSFSSFTQIQSFGWEFLLHNRRHSVCTRKSLKLLQFNPQFDYISNLTGFWNFLTLHYWSHYILITSFTPARDTFIFQLSNVAYFFQLTRWLCTLSLFHLLPSQELYQLEVVIIFSSTGSRMRRRSVRKSHRILIYRHWTDGT